jgi:hypothetical protein
MTVAKTLWGKVRLPFEWALALIREPALLALWVLVPVALAHACAVAELDSILIESAVSSVISHIQKIVD